MDPEATKRTKTQRQARSPEPKGPMCVYLSPDLRGFLKRWKNETGYSESALISMLVRRERQRQEAE